MSLAHAILGLLRDRPMTGYDLKTQCFDASVGHFWSADQAQIYRTLDKLREAGWVRDEIEPGDGRPDRRVHTITNAGRDELQRWICDERHDLTALRLPFLVQLFFADTLAPRDARALLEDRREKLEARLAEYRAIPLPPLKAKGVDRATKHQRMTLDLGLRLTRAEIAWVDACIDALSGK